MDTKQFPFFSVSEEPDNTSPVEGEPRTARSSILKPQKPRTPFQEITFGYTCTTEDFDSTRKRRVSFAGVNIVKEFCSKTESQHIGHIPTYEETFSLSSDSSQFTSSNLSRDLGTKDGQEQEEEESTLLEGSMDLTNSFIKETEPNFPTSNNAVANQYSLPVFPNRVSSGTLYGQRISMELTQAESPNYADQMIEKNATEMEFTEVLPTSRFEEAQSKKPFQMVNSTNNLVPSQMEFTNLHSSSKYTASNIQDEPCNTKELFKPEMDFRNVNHRQSMSNMQSEDMEFTKAFTHNVFQQRYQENKNVPFKANTNVSYSEMEFTNVLHRPSMQNENCFQPSNEDVRMLNSQSMEFTNVLHKPMVQNENCFQPSNEEIRTLNSQSMEFTNVLRRPAMPNEHCFQPSNPGARTLNFDAQSMEFTNVLRRPLIQNDDFSKPLNEEIRTLNVQSQLMELTNVPQRHQIQMEHSPKPFHKEQDVERNSNFGSLSMEFTNVLKQSVQHEHFLYEDQEVEKSMEFTNVNQKHQIQNENFFKESSAIQEIKVNSKNYIQPVMEITNLYRKTILTDIQDDDMEFTEVFPPKIIERKIGEEAKTSVESSSHLMELTNVLPPKNNLLQSHYSDDMDLTKGFQPQPTESPKDEIEPKLQHRTTERKIHKNEQDSILMNMSIFDDSVAHPDVDENLPATKPNLFIQNRIPESLKKMSNMWGGNVQNRKSVHEMEETLVENIETPAPTVERVLTIQPVEMEEKFADRIPFTEQLKSSQKKVPNIEKVGHFLLEDCPTSENKSAMANFHNPLFSLKPSKLSFGADNIPDEIYKKKVSEEKMGQNSPFECEENNFRLPVGTDAEKTDHQSSAGGNLVSMRLSFDPPKLSEAEVNKSGNMNLEIPNVEPRKFSLKPSRLSTVVELANNKSGLVSLAIENSEPMRFSFKPSRLSTVTKTEEGKTGLASLALGNSEPMRFSLNPSRLSTVTNTEEEKSDLASLVVENTEPMRFSSKPSRLSTVTHTEQDKSSRASLASGNPELMKFPIKPSKLSVAASPGDANFTHNSPEKTKHIQPFGFSLKPSLFEENKDHLEKSNFRWGKPIQKVEPASKSEQIPVESNSINNSENRSGKPVFEQNSLLSAEWLSPDTTKSSPEDVEISMASLVKRKSMLSARSGMANFSAVPEEEVKQGNEEKENPNRFSLKQCLIKQLNNLEFEYSINKNLDESDTDEKQPKTSKSVVSLNHTNDDSQIVNPGKENLAVDDNLDESVTFEKQQHIGRKSVAAFLNHKNDRSLKTDPTEDLVANEYQLTSQKQQMDVSINYDLDESVTFEKHQKYSQKSVAAFLIYKNVESLNSDTEKENSALNVNQQTDQNQLMDVSLSNNLDESVTFEKQQKASRKSVAAFLKYKNESLNADSENENLVVNENRLTNQKQWMDVSINDNLDESVVFEKQPKSGQKSFAAFLNYKNDESSNVDSGKENFAVNKLWTDQQQETDVIEIQQKASRKSVAAFLNYANNESLNADSDNENLAVNDNQLTNQKQRLDVSIHDNLDESVVFEKQPKSSQKSFAAFLNYKNDESSNADSGKENFAVDENQWTNQQRETDVIKIQQKESRKSVAAFLNDKNDESEQENLGVDENQWTNQNQQMDVSINYNLDESITPEKQQKIGRNSVAYTNHANDESLNGDEENLPIEKNQKQKMEDSINENLDASVLFAKQQKSNRKSVAAFLNYKNDESLNADSGKENFAVDENQWTNQQRETDVIKLQQKESRKSVAAFLNDKNDESEQENLGVDENQWTNQNQRMDVSINDNLDESITSEKQHKVGRKSVAYTNHANDESLNGDEENLPIEKNQKQKMEDCIKENLDASVLFAKQQKSNRKSVAAFLNYKNDESSNADSGKENLAVDENQWTNQQRETDVIKLQQKESRKSVAAFLNDKNDESEQENLGVDENQWTNQNQQMDVSINDNLDESITSEKQHKVGRKSVAYTNHANDGSLNGDEEILPIEKNQKQKMEDSIKENLDASVLFAKQQKSNRKSVAAFLNHSNDGSLNNASAVEENLAVSENQWTNQKPRMGDSFNDNLDESVMVDKPQKVTQKSFAAFLNHINNERLNVDSGKVNLAVRENQWNGEKMEQPLIAENQQKATYPVQSDELDESIVVEREEYKPYRKSFAVFGQESIEEENPLLIENRKPSIHFSSPGSHEQGNVEQEKMDFSLNDSMQNLNIEQKIESKRLFSELTPSKPGDNVQTPGSHQNIKKVKLSKTESSKKILNSVKKFVDNDNLSDKENFEKSNEYECKSVHKNDISKENNSIQSKTDGLAERVKISFDAMDMSGVFECETPCKPTPPEDFTAEQNEPIDEIIDEACKSFSKTSIKETNEFPLPNLETQHVNQSSENVFKSNKNKTSHSQKRADSSAKSIQRPTGDTTEKSGNKSRFGTNVDLFTSTPQVNNFKSTLGISLSRSNVSTPAQTPLMLSESQSYNVRVKNREYMKQLGFERVNLCKWRHQLYKDRTTNFALVMETPLIGIIGTTQILDIYFQKSNDKQDELIDWVATKFKSMYPDIMLKADCLVIDDLKNLIKMLDSEVQKMDSLLKAVSYMKKRYPCNINGNMLTFSVFNIVARIKLDVSIELRTDQISKSNIKVKTDFGSINESVICYLFEDNKSEDKFYKFVKQIQMYCKTKEDM